MIAPLLFGVGLLLAIMAASSRAGASSAPAPSESVAKIVGSGDPQRMLVAATVAEQSGDRQLGSALRKHAKNAAVAHPAATYPSPFPSVPTPAWTSFVHALRGSDPKEVSPSYHLGLFAFSMPRLVDLGLARNPHKVDHDGKSVWDADWIPPLTLESFLANAGLQYDTFVKAVTADLLAIKAKFPTAVGSDIDGTPASPSGLLAVTKMAGLKGLETWLASADTRKQYAHTTALFHKVNGIF